MNHIGYELYTVRVSSRKFHLGGELLTRMKYCRGWEHSPWEIFRIWIVGDCFWWLLGWVLNVTMKLIFLVIVQVGQTPLELGPHMAVPSRPNLHAGSSICKHQMIIVTGQSCMPDSRSCVSSSWAWSNLREKRAWGWTTLELNPLCSFGSWLSLNHNDLATYNNVALWN